MFREKLPSLTYIILPQLSENNNIKYDFPLFPCINQHMLLLVYFYLKTSIKKKYKTICQNIILYFYFKQFENIKQFKF
ncbi:hypothetical protein E27107_10094 [Elizabethkingia anophelis]|nr:hypothetical protein E27107_10094 [Elizabethkingia anophelis]